MRRLRSSFPERNDDREMKREGGGGGGDFLEERTLRHCYKGRKCVFEIMFVFFFLAVRFFNPFYCKKISFSISD